METNYFEVIKKAKENNSILKAFGYENNLEKSHVENIFEHDAPERGFTIDKKGNEIKERLRKMLSDEQQVVTMLQLKFTDLLSKFDKQPTSSAIKVCYYMVDGWEDKLGDLPLMFEWDGLCCAPADEYMSDTSSQEEESCKTKREYNELVQKYIGAKREVALLQTMLDNFSDTKVYKLTVKEATMLGW